MVAFVLSALIANPKYHLNKLGYHREVVSLLRRYNVELFLIDRHVHIPAEPKDPKVIFTTLKPCSKLDDAHKVSL